MSKVIAISDAPFIGGKIAYSKGQIFDSVHLSKSWGYPEEILIHNHNLGCNMICSSKNFIPISEWRLQRIQGILDGYTT